MKINEVEARVGITKKNIRFYEEQGLLRPRRNSDNGYRDYGEEDVCALRRIKLFRKLGVPIEDIRQMLDGTHTVGDCMRRQMVTIEREQRNLEQSALLCAELQHSEIPANELDAEKILSKMEEMEKKGTLFRDGQKHDVRIRFGAPLTVTVIMLAIMIGVIALFLWAFKTDPQSAPPIWVICLLILIPASIGIGVVIAFTQRIRELMKGEMEDAKRY